MVQFMIMTTFNMIIAAIVALACAGAGYLYVQTRPISADQQIVMQTRSGATFSIEKGWIATESDDIIILQEPGKELTVALIENNQDSAANAVLAAWQRIQPDFARTVKHEMVVPATDGWDEVVQFIYETTTAENRFLLAVASRVGTTWYVGLLDGTPGAASRRGAGINLVFTSFKVPGVEKESFAGKVAHKLDDEKLTNFINFIKQAQALCEIPGVAIGIVQDGKLICAQGLGVKQLGGQDLVTPETQFMIGSTTKSLTTLMMAKLVEEGKFNWDTPVIKVFPMFELGDKQTTEKLLMKHTVSANTGMPRHDVEMFFNWDHATAAMRLAEMKAMKPTTGFGETFQYNNSMVAAGGYIAGHAAYPDLELGVAYDKVMQTRVFDPLNMTSTTFDFNTLNNFALPHGKNLQNDVVAMPVDSERWSTSIRPAGAAWSNVHDMAQYMIMELHNGVNAQNKRIISQANLLKRREAQIKIADTLSYGLGLMVGDDHGVQFVGHGGNTAGFTSEMFFLPEHHVGTGLMKTAE